MPPRHLEDVPRGVRHAGGVLSEGGSGTARGERLGAVRLVAHEVIREVFDRHGVAE